VNGDIQKQKVMECIIGRQVIGMKVNGSVVSNMGKEQIYLLMVMSTLVNTRMVNLRERDNMCGQMEVHMLVNLNKELNREKESGRVQKGSSVTHMKEIT
jgi:hypothetical protein